MQKIFQNLPAHLPFTPNHLTYLRLALLPCIILLLMPRIFFMDWLAFIFFVLVAITDYLDGWMARRQGTETQLGAMMDQISDKLVTITILITLIFMQKLEFWGWMVTLIIVGREIWVSGLREHMGTQLIHIPVSRFGKIKTALQFVGLGALLLPGFPPHWGLLVLMISAGFGLYSAWQYNQKVFSA